MMREVLTRRFKRLVLDEAEAPTRHRHSARPSSATPGAEATGLPRIEQPQPPPIDRRGGSALAFGVLRADDDGTEISETEPAPSKPMPSESEPAATSSRPGRTSC